MVQSTIEATCCFVEHNALLTIHNLSDLTFQNRLIIYWFVYFLIKI